MGLGKKLRTRWTVLLVVVLAASAVGVLTPTISNTVDRTVQVTGPALTLTVEGVPTAVAPGELFRVVATMTNNANRPIPAVLRMEARNPNNTAPNELTVYAGCGAEEVVSSRTLLYYIGWDGPLLAAKGVSFPAGTTLATLTAELDDADYWPVILHEIADRDILGYQSLIDPGLNASEVVRNSGSVMLKILNYYGMVSGSADPMAWALTMPFTDHVVASGNGDQSGFLVEIHPQSRGSFELKFWAERPDGLGIPNHPTYTCGPL
jgi:hypothetical protein